MKLKVCGMKYVENIRSVAEVKPNYMGFIFYEKSKRNFEGIIPDLPKGIKKAGVFVNEPLEILVSLVEEYQLEAVQLHGEESVAYIQELRGYLKSVEIIKVFGIKDNFNFSVLAPYQDLVDYFLFDTKGKERGGNGVKFNWSVLKEYPYAKPFFLSGGIGPKDVVELTKIKASGLPIYAVDINSRFESEPGLKKVKEIKKFKNQL
jgi:phosphoribosylanthranilate isomerase